MMNDTSTNPARFAGKASMVQESDVQSAAREILRSAVVWDNVFPLEPWCGNGLDRLDELFDAGYTAVSLTLAGDNQNISEAMQRVATARREILGRQDRLVLIESVDDVLHAKQSDRLAVGFHFEGTRCFERNLDVVEAFYRLGIRQTILAFNLNNSVGGGCADRHDCGLTKFGVRLVREFSRVGMLIDLSHTGPKTSRDAIELIDAPCVFSHSNAFTLHPHHRNVRDEELLACVAKGGLVGVSSSNEYLGSRTVTADAVFRHVDYFVQKVGPEHVGLGFDLVFDAEAITRWVRDRPDEWPMTVDPSWLGFSYGTPALAMELTQCMLTAGYPLSAIQAILGGNWIRVCRQVWK